MSSITIKVSLASSVRRITVPRTSTWRELTQQLSLLYQIPSTSGLTLRYKDEDGDDITVSSDIELAGLLQDAKSELIKFDVIIPGYKPRPPSPEPLAEPLSPSTESTARSPFASASYVYPPPPHPTEQPTEKNFDYHMAQFEKHIKEAMNIFEHEVRNAGNKVSVEYGKFKENNPDVVTKVQTASQKVVNEVKHVFDELFGQGSAATVVPVGGATVVGATTTAPPPPPRPQEPIEPYHVEHEGTIELDAQLTMLNEMGFTNHEANRDLLMQYDGNVNAVVEVLTEQLDMQNEMARH